MQLKKQNTVFLTVNDFMQRYGISRTQFYREVNRKAIPIVKIGRATRIRVRDADAWASRLPTKGGCPHGE